MSVEVIVLVFYGKCISYLRYNFTWSLERCIEFILGIFVHVFSKSSKAQNSVVYTLSIKFLHILFWIKRP